VEGGSVPEEFRIEYVADRVHTFGTAFLGLTMECTRCHDHKYDPGTQKDYFSLSAFFNNIDEAGLYSYFTGSTPTPTLELGDLPSDQKIKSAQENLEGYSINQKMWIPLLPVGLSSSKSRIDWSCPLLFQTDQASDQK